VLQFFKYSFDNVGNISNIDDAKGGALTESFVYDDLYRLTETGLSEGNIYWGYDAINNITSVGNTFNKAELNVEDIRYGEEAGPYAVTRRGDKVYEYDLNGNMTNMSGMRLVYDVEDRLVGAVKEDGGKLDLVYDHEGERKIKRGDGEVLYVDDNFEIRAGQSYKYVWLDGQRLARIAVSEGEATLTAINNGQFLAGLNRPRNPFPFSFGMLLLLMFLGLGVTKIVLPLCKGETEGVESSLLLGKLLPKRVVSSLPFRKLLPKWLISSLPLRGRPGGGENYPRTNQRFTTPRLPIYSRVTALILAVTLLGSNYMGCTGGMISMNEEVNNPSNEETELTPQEGVVYYLTDHLGNTQMTVDSLGNVIHEETRYPYGLERNSTEDTSMTDYVYTGKEYDTETGLIYFGKRYYSPELGRWLTADPLFLEDPTVTAKKHLSSNLYAYVRNNPVKYVDPDGNIEGCYGSTTFTGEEVDYSKIAPTNAGERLFVKTLGYFSLSSLGLIFGAGIGTGTFIGSLTGGGFNGYKAYRREGEFNENVVKSVPVGIFAGFFGGSGKSAVAKVLLGGTGGLGGNIATQVVTGTPYDQLNWKSAGISGGVGAVGGFGSYLASGLSKSTSFEISKSFIIGVSAGSAKMLIEERMGK
jgi:RHS repeat-associated protein